MARAIYLPQTAMQTILQRYRGIRWGWRTVSQTTPERAERLRALLLRIDPDATVRTVPVIKTASFII